MGDTTTLSAPPVPRHDEWLDRRWRVVGGLVVLVWLFAGVGTVVAGEKPSSYGDLLAAVADGRVAEVTVVGYGPGESAGDTDWRGTRVVELRWDRWIGHYAEVEVRRRADGTVTATGGGVSGTSDPHEAIAALSGDVRLTDQPYRSQTSAFGWRVPGVVAGSGLVAWLAGLLLLIGGPQPWRATRWAWAWVWVLGPPVAGAAYVLLGGPLGRLRPRDGARRLTGGWAFLLALVLFAGSRAG